MGEEILARRHTTPDERRNGKGALIVHIILLDANLAVRFLCLWQGAVNFKFGVLFAKDGQVGDDEMYGNGKKTFLSLI